MSTVLNQSLSPAMDSKEKTMLKAFLMTHLLGQMAGGLHGLAPTTSNRQRERDIKKVELYVDSIMSHAGR